MEEAEKEENHTDTDTDNSCPNFYPYVPGKSKSLLSGVRFISTALSEKDDTSDLATFNSNHRLSRPINLFSSEFRKIDTDLKKMHRLWSNID